MVGVTVDGAKGGVVRCCCHDGTLDAWKRLWNTRFKQPNSWEQDLHVPRFLFFASHRSESLKCFSFGVWAWSFGGYCGEVRGFPHAKTVFTLSIRPRTVIQSCNSLKMLRHHRKHAGTVSSRWWTNPTLDCTHLNWRPWWGVLGLHTNHWFAILTARERRLSGTTLGYSRSLASETSWNLQCTTRRPCFWDLRFKALEKEGFGHLGLRSHWSKWIILLHHLLWSTPPCCTCRWQWWDVFTDQVAC